MQFPFTLPTTNYLLIGGAVLGFVIFAAVAYFLFFKKSSSAPSSSEEEAPLKMPESFENMDAAGEDDAEGYEESSP
jgi:hypothetical protein